MGKSKAHYRQLARAAENAATKAVNDGTATEDQQALKNLADKRFRQERLSRIQLETKGDRSQRADRRDGIGMAPTVGAGRAENVGRLRVLGRSVVIDRSLMRSITPTSLGTELRLSETKRYQRIAIAAFQLIEVGRSPYLRLASDGKQYLVLLGTGDQISFPASQWLGTFLDRQAVDSLMIEWSRLLERSSEY